MAIKVAPTFNKKQHLFIANLLKRRYHSAFHEPEDFVCAIAHALEQDNPEFKLKEFLDIVDCDLEEEMDLWKRTTREPI